MNTSICSRLATLAQLLLAVACLALALAVYLRWPTGRMGASRPSACDGKAQAAADFKQHFFGKQNFIRVPIPGDIELQTNTMRKAVFWHSFADAYLCSKDRQYSPSIVAFGIVYGDPRWYEWWDRAKGWDLANELHRQRTAGTSFDDELRFVREHWREYFTTPEPDMFNEPESDPPSHGR